MALLMNGAGTSAADPILNGLGLEWVIAASTMDAATFTNAWIDTSAGFPGTNSVSGQLSPATTVVTQGNAGSYSNTTHYYAISSTTGMAANDYIYLSGGTGGSSVTGGIYKILAIVDSTHFSLVTDPLSGAGGAITAIAYEVAWRTTTTVAGTAPLTSSAGGTQNFFKAQLADSTGNAAQQSDSDYIRNAPAITTTSFMSLGGLPLDGTGTVNSLNPAFTLLSAWTNFGGVSYVQLTAHSVQTSRTDFTFSDASITEKVLSNATTNGLKFTAGDGIKYGRILLKSISGAAVTVGQDIQITLDTTAPTITFTLNGR